MATLATDRALLPPGVPGTAKSWVSEHMAAAICGDSTMIVQCAAGTDENQIRYGWNYAQLLANGPSREALAPTPLFRAMESGRLCRLEELARMGSDVQDTLITALSEMMLPIPELNDAVYAARGIDAQPPAAQAEDAPDDAEAIERNPIGALAAAAGYEDGESGWRDVIEENPAPGPIFAAVADAMAALRDHAPPPEGIEAAREAHMRLEIGKVQKENDGPIAVVCGAWHAPALSEKRPAVFFSSMASSSQGSRPPAKPGRSISSRNLAVALIWGAGEKVRTLRALAVC